MLCVILPVANSLFKPFLILPPVMTYKMPIVLDVYEVTDLSLAKKNPFILINKMANKCNYQTWGSASSKREREKDLLFLPWSPSWVR